ncbi:AfsR/SARP family transcriptional regulator [Dactylosporangium siamense]|uniref:SARP family transcriptional regulator n=1 Tax=Dactylosporangium siamense TaxID=685454 RepID=A0A919UAV2_9ACTN|nr:BTAD domain-containing putative transcriptional regulator [Dactylosporangium siamense]GIG45070.1 SARP family transcriptional regulator [Dactylosporangium siamense]
MQVRLLGPIDVTLGGAPREVPGLRRKAVLATLAIGRGEVVSTDRLIDTVWGEDPPATAVNTLQRHVSYLRQVLGGRDTIVARPPGYLLALDDDATDVAVAERLIRQGTGAAEQAERVRCLRAALALWRGRPLADVAGLTGLDLEAERLEALRLHAQSALVESRLQLGEHAQLVPELERLTRDHPLDEGLHAHLMTALHRSGRPADALATYQRLRQALADELGLDPGPGIRDLEAAVLRGDAALDPAAPPAATVSAPAQLPLAVRGFAGHAGSVAQLDALAQGAARSTVVCAVSGPPGVGKTSLAVHWAHRVADRFPDGQLYVNLRGFDHRGAVMDPAEALRGFLRAFRPDEQLPAALDERATRFRSVLAGKRVLIILDNARDADQVRPLLPGTPGCLVLVTSRNQLTPLVAAEGAHPLALDLLSAGEARELLTHRLGAARTTAEPDAVMDIVERCARLPLALAIAAAHASTRPGTSLATQAAQLRDTAGGLNALDGGDPITDVRAVFSWSYLALTDAAARLFRLLGLHPGPDLGAPAAASLAGVPVPRARALLHELVEANLLTEHTPGRYGFHDLLRSYAAEQAGLAPERADAVRRVFDHYLHAAHGAVLRLDSGRAPADLTRPAAGVTVERVRDGDAAMAWFTAEDAVLLAAVRSGADEGLDDHVWKLAWTLTTYLEWLGRWDDLIDTQAVALRALLRVGDLAGRAHVHRDLGRTLARVGRFEDAAGHLDRALELYRGLGDAVGQARTHHNIGWMLQAQQRHADALTHSEQALHLFETAGDILWQARTSNAAGWLHAQLGNHRRTLDLCGRALQLLQQLGDRHGEAGTWDSLAVAHDHLGDHAQATRCYEKAIALFEQLGDRPTAADILVNAGDRHHTAGDDTAAGDSWRRALRHFEALGDARSGEVRRKLDTIRSTARGRRIVGG